MWTIYERENPTNLKVHLRSTHKEANLAYLNKVKENTENPFPETEPNPGNVTGPGSMTETTAGQRTLQECFHRRPDSCWLVNTQEHHKREEALVNLFIDIGMCTRLCEPIAFKKFANVLEPKFKTPGAARVNSLIGAKMDTAKQKLKEIIKDARKLTLCVDGWSKRGLTSSFMGVSACFYHPPGGQVQHALLNLYHLEHPHTGEYIVRCIDQTLDAWGIGEDKVLLIVADNGCNIVKAVWFLRDKKREQSRESDGAVSQAQPRGVGTSRMNCGWSRRGQMKRMRMRRIIILEALVSVVIVTNIFLNVKNAVC